MNSRILALGLFVLAAVGGAVWFTGRPPALQRGAESPDRTTTERVADPRLDLARPDGSTDPDERSARPATAIPPADPASNGIAATSAPIDPGVPVGVDQATDGTRGFAEKYRDVATSARRSALLVLESEIAERVETGDLDPDGKTGPSFADLKAEAEWLRTNSEG